MLAQFIWSKTVIPALETPKFGLTSQLCGRLRAARFRAAHRRVRRHWTPGSHRAVCFKFVHQGTFADCPRTQKETR